MAAHYFKKFYSRRKFFLTKDGLDTLRKQLDELTLKKLKTIQRLRLMDASDKAEELTVASEIYDLEKSEGEISELHNLLQKVEPLTKRPNPSIVELGCVVTVDDGTADKTYTVVSPLEVDPGKGKISEESILGQALLGKKVNDIVTLTMPKGNSSQYRIVAIR